MSLVRTHWVILGIAAALLGFVPYQVLRTPEQSEPPPMSFARIALRVKPVGGLEAALVHPIFSVDRAPDKPADPSLASAPAAPPPPPPLPTPRLVGVALARSGFGIVLVKGQDGTTKTVSLGSSIDGWRLVAIARDRASFRQARDTQTVVLDFHNKSTNAGLSANAPIPLPPSKLSTTITNLPPLSFPQPDAQAGAH